MKLLKLEYSPAYDNPESTEFQQMAKDLEGIVSLCCSQTFLLWQCLWVLWKLWLRFFILNWGIIQFVFLSSS